MDQVRSLSHAGLLCGLLSLWCLSGIASAQTPTWAVVLATAGPLADGASTYYALQQPGLGEGNPLFSRFTPGGILAVKIGEAAVLGVVVQRIGRTHRRRAIWLAVGLTVVHGSVTAWNLRLAQRQRLRQ